MSNIIAIRFILEESLHQTVFHVEETSERQPKLNYLYISDEQCPARTFSIDPFFDN